MSNDAKKMGQIVNIDKANIGSHLGNVEPEDHTLTAVVGGSDALCEASARTVSIYIPSADSYER